ncbi:hypothetical protein HWV62_4806 [Athelia sp. TMB]|nr:hypothetical protein HWV62_4806 [Athelia sp. TMB]
MATIHQPPPSILQRRPRSPEIINVDELDDELLARPRQRRRVAQTSDRDVIVISDSDDEDGSHAGPSQPREAIVVQSRRMRSPPLMRQASVVPPVPTLPRHLHSHRSMPMRRLPPSHPVDIVRPIDRPFNFENMRDPEPQHRHRTPPLAPAPPSHHIPVMGLGGALLATRANVWRPNGGPANRGPQEPRPPPARRNNIWSLGNFRSFFGGPGALDEQDDDPAFSNAMLLELLADGFDDIEGHHRHSAERPLFMSHHPRRVRHFEPEYKPTYTHRGKPEPGFTFDFAPPGTDEPSPATPSSSSSSSKSTSGEVNLTTTLVCARCVDPLVTSDSVTGEEHARRKIWALRCGHMLDGKCVEDIMKPHQDIIPSEGTSSKGKGKATEPMDESLPLLSEPSTMRSRLRPRPGSSSSIPTPLPSLSSRAKGKGKNKAFQVAEDFNWICPVPGCSHEHTSLKIDGKWTQDPSKGAIAMYV